MTFATTIISVCAMYLFFNQGYIVRETLRKSGAAEETMGVVAFFTVFFSGMYLFG